MPLRWNRRSAIVLAVLFAGCDPTYRLYLVGASDTDYDCQVWPNSSSAQNNSRKGSALFLVDTTIHIAAGDSIVLQAGIGSFTASRLEYDSLVLCSAKNECVTIPKSTLLDSYIRTKSPWLEPRHSIRIDTVLLRGATRVR